MKKVGAFVLRGDARSNHESVLVDRHGIHDGVYDASQGERVEEVHHHVYLPQCRY